MANEERTEFQKLQAEVIQIKGFLDLLIGSDRYTIQKTIQMFDERNIQTSTGVGTQIATASTQKLGLWGTTPVDQPETVADASGCNGDADDRLNELIDRLQEIGIIK